VDRGLKFSVGSLWQINKEIAVRVPGMGGPDRAAELARQEQEAWNNLWWYQKLWLGLKGLKAAPGVINGVNKAVNDAQGYTTDWNAPNPR
jgi:hypothetical protein